MKRFILGITAASLLMGTSAFAQPAVANTSQKGSLLIFPAIEVSDTTNTWVRIANDNSKMSIDVHCFWGYSPTAFADKVVRDFSFSLTPNQAFWFEAATGTGTGAGVATFPVFPATGELVCFATDAGRSTQVKFNHLSGTATVLDVATAAGYEYPAWAFYANAPADKAPVGTAGRLDLAGTANGQYDKCPQYLIGHFTPEGAPALGAEPPDMTNTLFVSSCDQKLTDEAGTALPQQLIFEVYNEEETRFSGARELIDSWWSVNLANIDRMGTNFLYSQLKTPTAYFRVYTKGPYVRPNPTAIPPIPESFGANYYTGLVGVLRSDLLDAAGAIVGTVGTPLNAAGVKTGTILWGTEQDTPEKM